MAFQSILLEVFFEFGQLGCGELALGLVVRMIAHQGRALPPVLLLGIGEVELARRSPFTRHLPDQAGTSRKQL
jgi:hypothetical protein